MPQQGMSNASCYKWRSRLGGMDTRLKEREDENRPLKKTYAEERLKAKIIQEVMAKSGEAIVGWLLSITDSQRNWGFGLYFLDLRNIKAFSSTINGCIESTASRH